MESEIKASTKTLVGNGPIHFGPLTDPELAPRHACHMGFSSYAEELPLVKAKTMWTSDS